MCYLNSVGDGPVDPHYLWLPGAHFEADVQEAIRATWRSVVVNLQRDDEAALDAMTGELRDGFSAVPEAARKATGADSARRGVSRVARDGNDVVLGLGSSTPSESRVCLRQTGTVYRFCGWAEVSRDIPMPTGWP